MSSEPQIAAEVSAEAPPPIDRRPDRLNDTILGVLAGQHPADIENSAREIFRSRSDALRAHYASERTRLTFRLKAIHDELDHLRETAASIEVDRQTQIEHQRNAHLLTGQIRVLDAEIRAKRYELERQRLRDEIDRLASAETVAHQMLSVERRAEYEQELRFWQETDEERRRRIEYLEAEKQKSERDLAAAEQKLESVRDRHITRTLSGFLLWVGYGSAAATGTVTAALLAQDNASSSPLADALAGLRAFILTISPTPSGLLILLIVGSLLLGSMIAVGAVIFLTDFVISRFDRRWRVGSGRGRTSRFNSLGPPDITRASYVQLLAAFPYVFTVGLIASVFVAGGTTADAANFFKTLFPSLVNTFIGTVLTLVSAAVFVMYTVKIIETRNREALVTWRTAWEFLVLPIVLLVALVTSIASNGPGRPVWGTWAAFMLLSSITLAYGIVYHGLFKDVDKLRWIARRFEDEIRTIASPPQLSAPARDEVKQAKSIAREFARERERLRTLDQQFSIKRILSADDDDFVLLDRWLRAYGTLPRWVPWRSAVQRSYDAYRVLDVHAAPADVRQREELRAIAAQHDTLIRDLQQTIDSKRVLTAAVKFEELIRQRNETQATLETSVFEEKVALANLEAEFAVELQQIRGAIALGTTHKPGFDAVRSMFDMPPAPPPPPTPFVVRPEASQ